MIAKTAETRKLLPHHLADLRASGLTDETIRKAGIYSEENQTRLAVMLNRKRWPRTYGAALVFPFFDADGAVVLRRVKPDNPPMRDGKVAGKYLSPSGESIHLYVPPQARESLDRPECPLVFSEGEKKSLAGTQAGIATIGLTGVDCWRTKRSMALLPELEAIDWKGRDVFIVFDSDAADNENVRTNESLLADALTKRGATVKVVRLPPGDDNSKVGLDDYLVAHPESTALHELLATAEEPEAPSPDEVRVPANQLDPYPTARAYLARHHTRRDLLALRYWRDEFHRWDGLRYVAVSESELRSDLNRYLDSVAFNLTRSTTANVLACVESECALQTRTEMPTWLDGEATFNAAECLVTRSGIVHLPSLVEGKPSKINATPRLFSGNALDYPFDETADCPTWKAFLESLWPDDPESIATLQEWFGYLLLPDTAQHKIALIVGPKRSGKGTIGRVLSRVVGEQNVATPTLANLAGDFGLWPLLGKTVALIADARLSRRVDGVAVVERLLSISGEDRQDVHRKNMPTLTGLRLPVRFVLLTNELPTVRDAAGAITSRMTLLRLTRSWYGSEDRTLFSKLEGELSGILNWAIHGWQRLRQRGHFVQPEAGAEMLQDLEDLASPVRAFVEDRCVVGREHSVACEDLFDAWKDWCKEHGRDHVGLPESFGRDLRAAVPTVSKRRRRVDGHRHYTYEGIKLAPVVPGANLLHV